MAVFEFGVNLVASLVVDLLSSGGEFSLKGVFWGHSMNFLLAVVGTVKPLEEPCRVFLLFLQGLGSGLIPPRPPWAAVGVLGFTCGSLPGVGVYWTDNPMFAELFILFTGYCCLQSGSNLFSFVRKQHLTHIVIILLF